MPLLISYLVVSAEFTFKSGNTFDSQETISDIELNSGFYVIRTPKNCAVEKIV